VSVEAGSTRKLSTNSSWGSSWNRALWKKAIYESSLLFLGCGFILFLFCWVRVWITSRLEMGRFQNILENLPESWQRLAPVPIDQLFSYEGRIAVSYEEPVVYLMMAIWAIARASDSVSGGLGRGTMEMLLAQPVSRRQVISVHTAVTLIGVFALATIAFLGTSLGINTTTVTQAAPPVEVPIFGIDVPFTGGEPIDTPMRDIVSPNTFLPAAVNYFGLGVFLVGFTTLMSSWDRYRWRTIGIAVGFYVVSTIVELLGLAVDSMKWVKCFTFFSAYEPVRFVSEAVAYPEREWAWIVRDAEGAFEALGPLSYDSILVGLGLVGIMAGITIFCRRDLPAPI